MNEPALIDSRTAKTLSGLLRERVRRSGDGIGYREFDLASCGWKDHAWQSIADRAARIQAAFSRLGLARGDRVAVLLPNGTDWVAFDMAALGRGLVLVPLFLQDSPANMAHVLSNSGARLLFVDTATRWNALAPLADRFPQLEHVWIREATDSGSTSGRLKPVPFAEQTSMPAGAPFADEAEPNELATIIYTSGTTGPAKGVMLSHDAILWNAEATARFVPPLPDDVFLSILPLAHAFERTVGYYLPMLGGSTIAYARSVQTLREDLETIRPTIFIAVPRLFERIHSAVWEQARHSRLKRRLLALAADIGWARAEAQSGRGAGPGIAGSLLWPLLSRRVSGPVRAAFGGRVRAAVSGGASLAPDIARFFVGLGVPVVEGYGMTETAPVITATALDDIHPGSAGRPLEGIELRKTDSGELLVRTPGAMKGYWRDDLATRRTIDQDGWLRTGDIAEIRDGRVFITGRIKEIIVLSTGKKIIPTEIESAITRNPVFAQAAVVGEGRASLAALAVVEPSALREALAEEGREALDLKSPEAQQWALARIMHELREHAHHERVRAVHLTAEPWTVESGLLTPTLKIKRPELERRFAAEIDSMYRDR